MKLFPFLTISIVLCAFHLNEAGADDCSADRRNQLLSDIETQKAACSTADSTLSAEKSGLQAVIDKYNSSYKSLKRKYGARCINGALAPSPNYRSCKGNQKKQVTKQRRTLLSKRTAAKKASARLAQLSSAADAACASVDSTVASLQSFDQTCVSSIIPTPTSTPLLPTPTPTTPALIPNPEPPPVSIFGPGAFDGEEPDSVEVLESNVPVTWLQARWWYLNSSDIRAETEYKTNLSYERAYYYKCSASFCIIEKIFSYTQGSYTFDGQFLEQSGTTEKTVTSSSGENKTTSQELRHGQVDVVRVTKLYPFENEPIKQKVVLRIRWHCLAGETNCQEQTDYLRLMQ